MLLNVLGIVVLVLAAGFAAVRVYGDLRWKAGTRELRARLEGARLPLQPQTVDFRVLEGLPPPVRRYLRKALKDGQPMIAGVHLQPRGSFNAAAGPGRPVGSR